MPADPAGVPALPPGWVGATLHEFARGREWTCMHAESGDVITLNDRDIVTLSGFDSISVDVLLAVLAHLRALAREKEGGT